MAVTSKVRTAFRWLAWPVVIVVALNIENAASQAGYGSLIIQHWKDSIPVLSGLYDIATTPWIIYPALILFGAVIYERALRTAEKAEKPGGGFQRWLIKLSSDNLSSAFSKRGYFRRMSQLEDRQRLNRRLQACGLKPVPETFSENEELNKVYASYLALISKGNFEHARDFIDAKTDFIRKG